LSKSSSDSHDRISSAECHPKLVPALPSAALWQHWVKALCYEYPMKLGRYRRLSEEDFDKVRPESTRVIDLVQFARNRPSIRFT